MITNEKKSKDLYIGNYSRREISTDKAYTVLQYKFYLFCFKKDI